MYQNYNIQNSKKIFIHRYLVSEKTKWLSLLNVLSKYTLYRAYIL